jgi:hypothetical protein
MTRAGPVVARLLRLRRTAGRGALLRNQSKQRPGEPNFRHRAHTVMPPAPTIGQVVRPTSVVTLLVLTAAVLVVACDANAGGRSTAAPGTTSIPTALPTTTVSPTTMVPTTVAPSTTPTTVLPPDPQSSPEAVSALLIHAWEKGDRATAAEVATASAISVLFAVPYGGEALNDRGCGSPGPNPVVCSWGPYGGASATNPLYNITVSPAGSAWYASTIQTLTTGPL